MARSTKVTKNEIVYCRCAQCGHKYDLKLMKPLGRGQMVCCRCLCIAKAERELGEVPVH